ncbi:MAG: CBS domain-containing protein [Acidobacteriota bacterium]
MKKAKDIMTKEVATCRPDTNLAATMELMWDKDCGVLPVVDNENKVVGIITDRDIAIAVGTRNKLASDINVGEVMTERVYSCSPEDNLEDVIDLMSTTKVRRLPVIDHELKLHGILSLNDVALFAEEAKGKEQPDISYRDAAITLKAICHHPKQRSFARA